MTANEGRAPRAIAIAAVLAAMVLVVLDAAIANVALPTIAQAFGVSPARSVWIVTAYQMALVMALLPCASLGDSRGHRRIFTLGVGLFTAASLACALSPSLGWLVAARFAQGLGGAAVMALGVALLRRCVSSEQLGSAIGWNALAVALASAAGPTIGAAILSSASWPWIFALKLPLGLAVLVAACALPPAKGSAARVDLVGIALNAGLFGAFIAGTALLPARPGLACLSLGASAFGLAMLVRRERSSPTPLIPLDLLGRRSIRISALASIGCFAGQTAGMVALPFHLQHGLGLDPLMTGLCMTPWPLTVALAAPIVGRLADRMPTASLCGAGGLGLAIGLGGLASSPAPGSPLALVPFTVASGLGFALFNVPNNRSLFFSAPPERSGAAGGLQATARLTGQMLGAILMTMLFRVVPAEFAPRIGFGVGAVAALCAGLVSAQSAERGRHDVNRRADPTDRMQPIAASSARFRHPAGSIRTAAD